MASKLFLMLNWYHFDASRWDFHFFKIFDVEMFIFWLLLICMTQKFYFVCSAYEKYELWPNCMSITICSICLRNLESICSKWRDQTPNFWFFTRFPSVFANIIIISFKVKSVWNLKKTQFLAKGFFKDAILFTCSNIVHSLEFERTMKDLCRSMFF